MGNLYSKGATFKLDDTTGTLADLTAYANNVEIKGAQEALEDTSLNDDEVSYVPGLASATLSANLFGNSTVNTILAPLVGNRTSLTKTIHYFDKNKWYAGEVLLTEVTVTGAAKALMTWAISGVFDGAVSNTTT